MINVAVYDFDPQAHARTVSDNVLMGAGLSLGYLSRIGPLKTTVAYSPQTNRVSAYINLGWPF
jgi:outer membrane translocation and assembly module TamA